MLGESFSCHFLISSLLDRFDFVCRSQSRINFEALELVDAPKCFRRKWYGWNVLVEFYLLASHSGVTFLFRPSLRSGTMHQAVQTGVVLLCYNYALLTISTADRVAIGLGHNSEVYGPRTQPQEQSRNLVVVSITSRSDQFNRECRLQHVIG